MRSEIISWIQECVDAITNDFKGNEEALILIKSFITQYELKSIKILESKTNIREKNKIDYLKSKIKHIFLESKREDVTFSTSSVPLDIVFWPTKKTHLDVQIGIYNELLKDDSIKVGLFSSNLEMNSILKKEKNGHSIYLKKVDSLWVDYKIAPYYKSIIKKAKELPPLKIKDRILCFNDVLLNAWNDWYWLYDYTIKITNNLIKVYTPKYVFTGNNITLVGNIASHILQNKGIGVFCIMHGTMSNYLEYTQFSYFYLFGKRDKINLIEKGISSSKLIVSGSPKIDFSIKRKVDKESRFRILVALSGPGHSIILSHHIEILKLLHEAASYFKEIDFYFKLHKKDKVSYYSDLASLPNVDIYEYGDTSVSSNIYDWIAKSDLVVSGASTSIIDAMIMKVPTITIDLIGDLKNVDFIKEGITLHVTDYDTFVVNVKDVLDENGRFKEHMRITEKYVSEVFEKPKNGTVLFLKEHIKAEVSQM